MTTKRFHYSDVLSVSDGRLVSSRGIGAVYEIMGHIVAPGVTTISITYLGKPVKKFLREKLPAVANDFVSKSLTVALNEWKRCCPDDKGGTRLPEYLDRYVLPHLTGEYIDVPAMEADAVEKLLDGYGEYFGKILDGKKVIGVVVEEDRP